MRDTKFIALGLIIVLLLMVTLTIKAAARNPAPTEGITWKAATLTAPKYCGTLATIWLAQEVEAKTNGGLKIAVYPSRSSGIKPSDALAAVRDRRVEIAWAWGTLVASEQPSLETPFLPGLVPPDEKVRRAVDDLLMPEFEKHLKKHRVMLLCYYHSGARSIFSRVPIRNLSEMKGKKIRCIGSIEAEFTSALGGAPTSIAAPEVYNALQRGIVDGAWIDESGAWTNKFWEVTKYVIRCRVGGAPGNVILNKDAFDALPNAIQKTFLDLRPAYVDKLRELGSAMDAEAWEKLTTVGGLQVITWPEADIKQMNSIAKKLSAAWYKRADKDSRKVFDIIVDYLKKTGYR